MVGLEDDERVIAQAERVEVGEDIADHLIECRDECGVHIARRGQVLVFLAPMGFALERVVRLIDRPVEEEGFVLMSGDKLLAMIDDQIAEVFAFVMDLFGVVPKIVAIGTVPVEEMGVVVDAAAHVAEGAVKAVGGGNGVGGVA